ncbi:MAG: hypothetical protein ACP5IZ_03825 [Thermoprotei archaeon]|jgi:hypothetical protein
MQLLIEKNILTVGEPIKVIFNTLYNESIEIRLYVSGITLLFDMEKKSKFFRTIFNKSIKWKIEKGEQLLTYPSWFPPSLGLKTFAIKWSLVSGVPRLGGKILFPRKEIRLKVYPQKMISPSRSETIIIDRLFYKPGDVIYGTLNVTQGNIKDAVIELRVTEYLKSNERVYSYTYQFSSADIKAIDNKSGEFVLKIPLDETVYDDRYIFYPYTFETKIDDKTIGVKSEIYAEIPNEFSDKQEIIIEPREIKLQKVI